MKISSTFEKLIRVTNKHLPSILTGVGLAWMVGGTVLAVKSTPEAVRQIDDATSERLDPLTNVEKFRLVWKEYIPAAISITVGGGLILTSQALNVRRQNALIALLATTESSLGKYLEQIDKVLEPEDRDRIRQSVAEREIESRKDDRVGDMRIFQDDEVPIVKFIDGLSGRTFYSDLQTVRAAVNDTNEEINKFNYASQNSFYDRLGLENVQLGDEYGWNLDYKLEVDYRTTPDNQGVPCYYIDYVNRPINHYYRYR